MNEDTGDLGWIRSDANRSIYDPLGVAYFGLAHDLLEHESMQDVGDEMQAHGALYYLRGPNTGWYSPNGNSVTATSLGMEWGQLFEAYAYKDGYLPDAKHDSYFKDQELESEIREIIRSGKQFVKDEYGEHDKDGLADLDRIVSCYAAHFRVGYRRAKRRFPNGYGYCLFNQVYEALKKHNPEFEGQQLEVRIDLKNNRVWVDEHYPEEVY
jgi:hypothetical protein